MNKKQFNYPDDYSKYKLVLKSILDNFKNGEELYRKNALFNTMINNLVLNGGNIYDFIEFLINENDRIKKVYEDYVKNETRPIYVYNC
jgi:hypothetical protein